VCVSLCEKERQEIIVSKTEGRSEEESEKAGERDGIEKE